MNYFLDFYIGLFTHSCSGGGKNGGKEHEKAKEKVPVRGDGSREPMPDERVFP